MEAAHRVLEIIKNILIVVLTLSAVLLLCFYWGNLSLDTLFAGKPHEDNPVQTADAPKTRDVILPAEIVLSFSDKQDSRRTVLLPEENDAWDTIAEAFGAFSKATGASLEETTKATYTRCLGTRSIRVTFDYDLPFDGFCKQFGIASAPFSSIANLTVLVYSESVPDSLFVLDAASGKYYRLVGDETAMAPLKNLLFAAESEPGNAYYSVQSTLGEAGNAVLPVAQEEYPYDLRFEKEIGGEEREKKTDAFAKLFFDNSFDFVRRVEDTKGTLTYLYGYSQKTLTIVIDGTAEYREEPQPQTVSQGFYASLGTALQFTAAHGGWYPTICIDGEESEEPLVPYLMNARTVTDGHRNGYRYEFGFRIGSTTVCPTDGAPVTVEVFDGQVTYYRRAMMKSVELSVREASQNGTGEEPLSIANVIAENSDPIYEALAIAGVVDTGLDDAKRFSAVVQSISHVGRGYRIDFAAGEDTVEAGSGRPVWIVYAGGKRFAFDCFEGVLR